MKKFLIVLLIGLLQWSTGTSQSLVPIMNFGTHQQINGYGDHIYVLSGKLEAMKLSAYNIKTGGQPKVLLKDIDGTHGYQSNYIRYVQRNGKVYAVAQTLANGLSLYEMDGRSAKLVVSLGASSDVVESMKLTKDNKGVFLSIHKFRYSLESKITFYDFTSSTHTELAKVNIRYRQEGYMPILGNQLYFPYRDSVTQDRQLWVSDGTKAGTQEFKPTTAPSSSKFSDAPQLFNGRIYFGGELKGKSNWFWTDGTKVETVLDKQTNEPLAVSTFNTYATDKYLVFGQRGIKGLGIMNKDHEYSLLSEEYIGWMAPTEDKIFFHGLYDPGLGWNRSVHHSRLFMSDGTKAGTGPAPDSEVQNDFAYMGQLIGFKGLAYFMKITSEDNATILQSDGTSKGTKVLMDSIDQFQPDSTFYGETSRTTNFLSLNNNLYVILPDKAGGSILYRLSHRAMKTTIATFYDANGNGQRDKEDYFLYNFPLVIGKNELKLSSNRSGEVLLNLESGNYSVTSPLTDQEWTFTNHLNNEATVKLPRDKNKLVYIGIKPTKEFHDVSGYLGHGRPVCSSGIPFVINVKNTGSEMADVQVNFEYDQSFSYLESSLTPTSLDTLKSTAQWKISDLKPLTIRKIVVYMKSPTFESMGDSFFYNVSFDMLDGSKIVASDSMSLENVLFCSYDPNDKLVSPSREFGDIYRGEKLKYTIRFQNTGNDTAFNVRIVDSLSRQLDLSTLKILGSSHAMEWHLDDAGQMTFFFDDIYLPDSATNDMESQGFLDYEVYPKTTMSFGERIQTKAFIFFDKNPAIVTNITDNILIDPTSLSNLGEKKEAIRAFPNPVSNELHLTFAKPGASKIQVTSLLGHEILLMESNNDHVVLSTEQWTSGVYLVHIEREGKEEVMKVIKE